MREIRQRLEWSVLSQMDSLALMLCGARLRHNSGTKWCTKRYLSMEASHKQELKNQLTA